jgi:hypothetical protein
MTMAMAMAMATLRTTPLSGALTAYRWLRAFLFVAKSLPNVGINFDTRGRYALGWAFLSMRLDCSLWQVETVAESQVVAAFEIETATEVEVVSATEVEVVSATEVEVVSATEVEVVSATEVEAESSRTVANCNFLTVT